MAGLVDGSIGIADEHLDLRDAVRSFADRHLSSEQVRVSIEADASILPECWKPLAEAGFLGLHLPEEYGGSGYGLLESCVVAEELGAYLTPGPFLGVVVTGAVLSAAGRTEHLAGLADGSLVATVATETGLHIRDVGTDLHLSGTVGPTPCLPLADLILARVDEVRWVLLERADLGPVEDYQGLDPTRRLGTAVLIGGVIPPDRVLTVPEGFVEQLWGLLGSAESCGSAAWSTRTAAEYASVREQFGRPIGAFQGVKHRCAEMLVRTEQARVVTWDAARALDAALAELSRRDEAPPGSVGTIEGPARFAAAVAVALAPAAALENAKACIDTLGAIGYTWEHDASFHLRRSRSVTLLVGSIGRWRERIGELALSGVRRDVGIDLPDEAETVREQVRSELAGAAALDGAERNRFLAEHGYTSPHLPKPWGKGADAVTQLVIAEELRAAGLRAPDMIIGNWVVPTLVEHGTEQQRQRWIPDSLTGDIFWCQLFSEPGAGSDLAALSTRAERVSGGWLVNGTKIWTSGAQYAQFGIMLARTDPEAAKHAGISYFVLDMSTPGIEIRPIRDLTGQSHFNQVFLDDVFVPEDCLIGALNQGWKLARTTLANERVALGSGSLLGSAGETLLNLVAAGEADQDQVRTLGRLLADAQSLSLFGLRSAIRSVTGAQPGAESSVAKYLGVTHTQEAWEVSVEWSGVTGLLGDAGEPSTTWWFLNSRNQSIAGGTLDVQRNIIGERLLGLPRDAVSGL